jgi:hypothetical protein
MPDDGHDNTAIAAEPANDTGEALASAQAASEQVVVPLPGSDPSPETSVLRVGGLDERGNTVKYIYARDPDYVVYYSRLEHPVATGDQDWQVGAGQHWLRRSHLGRFGAMPVSDPSYESEGVQAQLSPLQRQTLRPKLLPLGTERAKLQALLSGWPRRQSYDTSIATALQLALDGNGDGKSAENALDTLRSARAAILSEREIAGRAQYVKFTLLSGLAGMLLLLVAQHNLFKDSGLFWLGTQAGLIGAVMSIALSLRGRTVALDIGFAGNLSDSVLRLIIGAVSGGTLVLLFSCNLIPPLHTLSGDLDARSSIFALLLGIIAGFVEKLVPSLLEDQAHKIGGGGQDKAPPAPADGAKAH